jgi:hypothetical protein
MSDSLHEKVILGTLLETIENIYKRHEDLAREMRNKIDADMFRR